MEWPKIIKNISNRIRAKKYLGILSDNLSSNPQHWNGSDYLTANEISLYVNRAIAKRADKVGEIKFILRDEKGQQIDDPLMSILAKPNKIFNGRQFWNLYQKYYDLLGEAYIFIERKNELFGKNEILGLHLLNPTMVKPFYKDGEIEKYEYNTPNENITYLAEEIIYVHNPDPKNPLRGVSLLRAGNNAISTELQISTYHAKILENGGKVEGVFKFNTGAITQTQLQELKDGYKKEYSQAKRSGLPLFLGGNADYVRTGLNPTELAYLETKKTTLEDICILTGVPKSMLASTSDVKFDNADADRSIFLREVINPLLAILCEALDQTLFPDGRNLSYVDPTPENISEKRSNLETANTIGALSINEKRAALKDLGMELDPVADGDQILIPFNLTPLEEVGENGNNTDNEKGFKKNNFEHPLKDPETRRLYYDMQIKRMDAREKPFAKELKKYFIGQQKRIETKIAEQKSLRKNLIEDILNLEIEVKIGKDLFLPILTDLLQKAGVDATELAGSKYGFNLNSDIKSWLDSRSEIFLRQINETTFEKLKQDFVENLAENGTREDLITKIQTTYKGINKGRAGKIARTETHNATQYGTMQGYQQAGMKIKIWVAVMDSHTRDTHAMVDGQERPLNRPFSNGLMYPGDPNAPAGEVINCRCVI